MAKKAYSHKEMEDDIRFMHADTRKLLEFAHERIEQARDRRHRKNPEVDS